MSTFQQIIKDINNKKFNPIYLLFGDETYFIDEITSHISENILTPSEKDFNFTVLYGKDTNLTQILGVLNKYPMMASYQVVILKEAQEFRDFDKLETYFKNPVSSTIFVINYKYKKLDKRKTVYKTLKNSALLFESKRIYDKNLPGWITDYVSSKGLQISEKACYLLAEYLGNDLKKITNELEKLFLDASKDKKISVQDIETKIGISKDYNVFELQKALGAKDNKKVAKIIQYIESNTKATPVPMVVAILFGFFSKLLALHETGGSKETAAKQIGIPPFVIKEHLTSIKNYGNKLPEAVRIIYEYDLKSKGILGAPMSDASLIKEMTYRLLFL